MANLGFIGLGRMGRHMARNLIKAGHTVTLFNRSQAVVDELVAEGGKRASSPAEVARNARVLFTCLTTPDVVESILRQALEGAQPGDIFVDHSTIGYADAQRIAAMCAEKGVQFIDAPVSGGPWGAEAGTLTIMCGGDKAAYEAVLPYLQIEGKKLYHLGPVGAGTVAKLCNNLLVGIHAAALAEAFVLGTKAGVDPKVLYEIISGATGNSAQIERNIPKFIFPGNFEAAFSVDHLHKDVALAVSLGKDQNVRMLLGALTQQLLEEARAAGYGQLDEAALIRPLEELTGVKVRA
ncbi:3-hydroxyisobutyrate dehydrogenase-like beta-hydroxyacid dehydrogenase [Symbiobacterium terraclitae]|jgi:3-hydroxyisobutyrate dehydrogenase-like beta-hydroxyacid dehydrogenase|uniref:3-hydroxyisobutyrate dehydrogenase-like beta-hydroxyacid dehydrogenase n=2 Tax=Symbiobacterium terraclitae TaxID=557451 RepID=A0ABS4JX29_9FIRM|nr:3-hydroxyisobutyrate dehydrogenase-like beta-hydroxyacid dehydrogenase [Symbiobacterium terraclitae]